MAITVPSWERQVRQVLVLFMNAQVQLFETNIDPGMGGQPTETVLWTGKARVQQIRAPREFSTGYQANSVTAFRFQLDPDDGPPFFPQGTQARVLDAGVEGDPNLELLSFVVNRNINASHRGVVTVDLTADMQAVDSPRITGMILSADDELPIVGAEVRLSTSELVEVAITDTKGRFWFTAIRGTEYEISAVATGYDTETVTEVYADDELTIELEVSP